MNATNYNGRAKIEFFFIILQLLMSSFDRVVGGVLKSLIAWLYTRRDNE